ncbi:MAG: hypothetical protein NC337_03840 [Roseburia sp.]|nr:hypothetical protein [Roseburia sp.]
MASKEQKREELEKSLREAGLMEETDSIESETKGDYWTFGSQTRGSFIFTKEKFIFIGGLGMNNFALKYSDIKGIKKSMINFFIPTGVTVTALDPESGKEKKYKCSVMKRAEWMEYLGKRANITV